MSHRRQFGEPYANAPVPARAPIGTPGVGAGGRARLLAQDLPPCRHRRCIGYTSCRTPGLTKSGKGRPKGAKDLVNDDLRALWRAFSEKNAKKAQRLFDAAAKASPIRALELLVKLNEFFLPKLIRTTIEDDSGPLVVEVFEENRPAPALPAAAGAVAVGPQSPAAEE